MTPQAFPDHKNRLVIFWAPKVACTSLAVWYVNGLLKSRGVEDFKKVATLHGTYTESQRGWLELSGYTLTGYQGGRLVLDEGYRGIFFVRDPFRRIVSAYIDKFVNHHGRPLLKFGDLHGVGQLLYRQMKGGPPADSKDYTGFSLVEMLNYIIQEVDKRKAGEAIALNRHYDAMVDPNFLRVYDQTDKIEICQIESGKSFELLNSITGIDFVPERFNISQYGEPGLLQDVANRGSVDLAGCDTVPHPSDFDTPEMRALVKRAYADDYRVLGYE